MNSFYEIGLEFIACDDNIALSEIDILTKYIDEYHLYLYKSGVSNEIVNVLDDLENKGLIPSGYTSKEDNIEIIESEDYVEKHDIESVLNTLIACK